jgi:hypothetical protein
MAVRIKLMIPRTEKPEIILKQLIEVDAWFRKNSINIKSTRFEIILDNLNRITKTSIDDFIKKDGFENYFFTALSAITFIDIFRGLSTYKGSLPKKKLIECLSGPLIPSEEILGDANVNPRNTFFELEIASRMMRCGFKVNGFDDVNLVFEKHKIFIECKRLLSKSNITHNIRHAYDQLSKKISNKNDRGIIALAIDRSYRLNDKLLDSHNSGDIGRNLNKIGDLFIKDYTHVWNAFLNLKVIGILLFINFGTVFKKTKILYSNQMCFISLRSDIQISDRNVLQRFAKKVDDNCAI